MKSSESDPSTSDESPRVPGFHHWRGVYIFVFSFFVLVVVLLTIFSRYFS